MRSQGDGSSILAVLSRYVLDPPSRSRGQRRVEIPRPGVFPPGAYEALATFLLIFDIRFKLIEHAVELSVSWGSISAKLSSGLH
jgi:hypothetical protein